jgi:iron complex transport system substrate-binding protein
VATTRRTFVLIAALAGAAAAGPTLTGCRRNPAAAPAGAGAAFTDELGRPVSPRHVPSRRVVSLAPNVTELLFAIDADDQLVGVDQYSDQPAGLVEKIRRVGNDYQPSLETIVALSPDVVFTSLSANRRETAEALERLGVPVFVTDTPAVADLDRTLRDLGAVTGHAPQAERQIAQNHAGFERLRRRARGRPRPRVLVVVWDEPLYVAGKGTFTHDLIDLAAGENVAADAVGFAKYPLERVLRAAPDVIVLPTHAPETKGAEAIRYWSRWALLPAVRTHRVHAIEDAIISRPGARLVAGAELLFGLFHPDAPADDDARDAR